MKKVAFLSGAALLTPFVALAQTADASNLTDIITQIEVFISAALPVVISLAVLLFLWGLVRYMTNADDAEARASSRSLMIWGVVIIFVMVSIWGLVNFLEGLFGLDDTGGTAPDLTL